MAINRYHFKLGLGIALITIGSLLLLAALFTGVNTVLQWLTATPLHSEPLTIDRQAVTPTVEVEGRDHIHFHLTLEIEPQHYLLEGESATGQVPRFYFPYRYLVTDQDGEVIKQDFDDIAWNHSARVVGREGGRLQVEAALLDFDIDDTDTIRVKFTLLDDTRFQARASGATLELHASGGMPTQPLLLALELIGAASLAVVTGVMLLVALRPTSGNFQTLLHEQGGDEALPPVGRWPLLAHLSALLLLLVPFGHLLGPALVWLLRRRDRQLVDEHCKRALNFQLSITIYMLLCVPLSFFFIGIPLLFMLLLLDLSMVLYISTGVLRRRPANYPFAIAFFSPARHN